MKLPSLSKLPKYRRFDFQPRYYDPVKEELQERVERITQEHKAKNNPNLSFKQRNIQFERRKVKNKFAITIQLYLVIFMLFDLFLLFKVKAESVRRRAYGSGGAWPATPPSLSILLLSLIQFPSAAADAFPVPTPPLHSGPVGRLPFQTSRMDMRSPWGVS